MKRAERIIRQQINELTIDCIATKRLELQQAIKWMMWQGTFRQKKYEQLLNVLNDKYTEVMHKFEQKVHEEMEIEFKLMLERNGMK